MINNSFITHDDLIKIGAKWLKNCDKTFYRCGVVLPEYKTYCDEIPDVIGFNHMRSVLIECKVSKTDYLADLDKRHRKQQTHLGNCRFYLTTPDIIDVDDLQNGWGLLHYKNNKVYIIKEPDCDTNTLVKQTEWELLYSIVRRCEIRGYLKDIESLESRSTWSK